MKTESLRPSDNSRFLPTLTSAAALATLMLSSGLARADTPDVSDLPLIEVPATGATSPILAVFVTGDGGWAGLDKGVSTRLAERGIATVGFNSRSYFWHAKTPEQTTHDFERLLRHYLAAWNKSRVLLVGYSFGADVLPFVISRLPQDLRARLVALSMMGVETTVSFEIHVTDWLPGVSSGGPPVAPEVLALGTLPVQCIYGEGERGTLCTRLPKDRITVERIGDGHHFGRDYIYLADRVLGFVLSRR